MTQEEIKKIAREYAEDVFREHKERNLSHLTDEEWELSISEVAKDTIDAFQWLSKDYAIVPKEQIYMRHGVANALMKQDPMHKEFYRGQSSVLESIFDKSLFEEEGK